MHSMVKTNALSFHATRGASYSLFVRSLGVNLYLNRSAWRANQALACCVGLGLEMCTPLGVVRREEPLREGNGERCTLLPCAFWEVVFILTKITSAERRAYV